MSLSPITTTKITEYQDKKSIEQTISSMVLNHPSNSSEFLQVTEAHGLDTIPCVIIVFRTQKDWCLGIILLINEANNIISYTICTIFYHNFIIYRFMLPTRSISQSSEQVKREGSLQGVCPKMLRKYTRRIANARYDYEWNPSVQRLSKLINQDPALRYNWEHGIKQSNNLRSYSSKNIFGMLNAILNIGPAYDTSQMVGFPINVLFIHLMQNQNGRTLFANREVNSALKEVLNDYGTMLTTDKSLTFMNQQNPSGWFSPKALKKINYSLYECNSTLPNYGFKNWNEWFLRDFTSGMRLIGVGTPSNSPPENVIINSCEATAILSPKQPSRKVKISTRFWLKGNKYSLSDMFGTHGLEHGYGSLFVKGTVFQGFLSALSYHHWHAPVSGQIIDIYTIPGTYFLDQSQFNQQFDSSSPDVSQSFISHTAARMVMIIKADNPKLGYIGLIYIGMAECSGVSSSKVKGDHVKQGDHVGNFLFGGSSYVMLFQKHAKISFTDNLYTQKGEGKQQDLLSHLALLQ